MHSLIHDVVMKECSLEKFIVHGFFVFYFYRSVYSNRVFVCIHYFSFS